MEFFCDNKRHLTVVPYSVQNLHTMAKLLDIHSCWFDNGTFPHYDIPKQRIDEIKDKCTIVSSRAILYICKYKVQDVNELIKT